MWFDFYGRILNIPRNEINCMPFGEMGDLIACYQILNGAEQKQEVDDLDMIPDIN